MLTVPGVFLCGVCISFLCLSGFSLGILTNNNMHVTVIGDSKLAVGVNVSMNGGLPDTQTCLNHACVFFSFFKLRKNCQNMVTWSVPGQRVILLMTGLDCLHFSLYYHIDE